MRIIQAETLLQPLKKMILDAAYNLECDIRQKIVAARSDETSRIGQTILQEILENADIASKEHLPICQDTGVAVFFVSKGVDCFVEGGLTGVIHQATAEAYRDGYLRKSMLSDPLDGINTNDNTPAVIWLDECSGDQLTISFTAKGGGAENMSAIKMLKPSDGVAGIKEFVVETVKKSGGNACPPMIIGVGIGGTFEKCAWLSKKALLRSIAEPNSNQYYANLEKELLELVNSTGVGPQGLGGQTTALGLMIESFPRHIASLPVAVNIQCHASRHKTITI